MMLSTQDLHDKREKNDDTDIEWVVGKNRLSGSRTGRGVRESGGRGLHIVYVDDGCQ